MSEGVNIFTFYVCIPLRENFYKTSLSRKLSCHHKDVGKNQKKKDRKKKLTAKSTAT